MTLTEAARGIIPMSSLTHARATNKEYAAMIEAALDGRDENAMDEMLNIAVNTDRSPKDKEVHIKTLQWILTTRANRHAKKIELTGGGGQPLNPYVVQVVAADG